MKYLENISLINFIFQNAMPLCRPFLFLPHGAMAQNVVMLNTCNCLLLVKCILRSTSTGYLRFSFSVNQIKSIKTLIIWHNTTGSQRKYIQIYSHCQPKQRYLPLCLFRFVHFLCLCLSSVLLNFTGKHDETHFISLLRVYFPVIL